MTNVRDHITGNHRRAARALGYALHADSNDIWFEMSSVWRARLTDKERAAMAYSVLKAITPEQQRMVFEALFATHDMPLPPLTDIVAETSDWAQFADDEQLRATALACFKRMSASDQAAFVDHVTVQRAA